MRSLIWYACVIAATAIWPPSPMNLDNRINITFCPGTIGSLAPVQGLIKASNFTDDFTGRLVCDVFITTDGRQWEQL